jgi:glutaminyl-tRNA synthetase
LNLYDVHFKSINVGGLGDKWREDINEDSLIVKNNAKIWNIHKKANIDDRFQFERLGYFVINENSNPKKGKYEFNRIVELKASKPKGN